MQGESSFDDNDMGKSVLNKLYTFPILFIHFNSVNFICEIFVAQNHLLRKKRSVLAHCNSQSLTLNCNFCLGVSCCAIFLCTSSTNICL